MSYQSVFTKGLFDQKTVIVTGGGSGIGRCVAHELSSLGAQVVILGRTLEKLQTVVAEIHEDGGLANYAVADIRDEARVTESIASVIERYGQIHGLVNNAGGQFPAKMETLSKKGFETVVSNNLTGGFLMCREVFIAVDAKAGRRHC